MASEVFKCNICSKPSVTQGKLNRHLKTHSKPFRCEACSSGFALRLDLERHVKARHRVGNNQHRCHIDSCSFKSSRKDNLKRHIRRAHSITLIPAKSDNPIVDATSTVAPPQIVYPTPAVLAFDGIWSVSMFMQAATFGDIAALKLMMKCGFTTETRADDQSTALHCAARNGQAETVQYLLKNGASCGIKNEKRRLPVHEAILGSDTETAKILIEHTSGTLFSDEEEHTERSLAQTKNIEIFELYAYHRGTSFTASHAVEIFHGAIRAKNDTMIAALLSRSDIDVNSHNRRAWAPVHLAAGIGNAKAMDLFLASDRIDKSLTTRYSRMNALHVAASKGHTKVVKQLLDFNFDVHSLDRRQRTPLHLAVVVGMLETITLLLNEGKSDPLRQDRKGYTPLQCAVSKRHWEAVQLLLEYLDPITTCSPTHTESVKKDFTKKDLVSRLLCHVDFKDPNLVLPGWEGLTMLHQAAEKGDCEVMEVLLAHEKIDVNVGNWYLSTPLMAAAGFRQIEAVRLLLRHPEIDVNQKNKPGSTALYYAKDYRHQEIVDLLLSHGAIDDEDINEAKTVTQTSNTSMTENNSHMHSIPLQSEHQNDPELNLDDFMEDIMDWDDLSDAENETSE